MKMRNPDDKINILFVIMQMGMGGSERLVHNLVLKLDRNEFNPSIAWFFGDKILKEFQDLSVPMYHVPKARRFDFSTMKKIGRVVRDNNIHIVNAHHFMSMVYAFYGCKIKNHAKLIYTEHSEWEIDKISLKWRILGSQLLGHADGAIGVSSAVTKKIKTSFKMNDFKTFTIQNGVDLKAFNNKNEKQTLREKIGITDSDCVIGTVANFKKIKNHQFLLKAFNELIKDNKNVKLLLIGQGFKDDADNTEQELRKFVNDKKLNEHVIFLGYRRDIPELLNIVDIFCLTSLKEGMPISLIEAMAAGIPVVGTNAEGIRDLILQNKNGYLVNNSDVEGLKKAFLQLIENKSLRQKMGNEAKSLIQDKYSLEECVKRYKNVFLSVI